MAEGQSAELVCRCEIPPDYRATVLDVGTPDDGGIYLFLVVSSKDLFRIDTDRLRLTWGAARGKEPCVLETAKNVPGTLVVRTRRNDLVFGAENWRSGVPAGLQITHTTTAGPRLFEQ